MYRSLSAEWALLSSGRAARRSAQRWAHLSPELATFSSPAAVVEFCHGTGGAPANRVLAALVGLAGEDELATRTLVQALLPGLAAMSRRARRRWPWMFDRACDGPWQDWGFDYEAVATAHARIRLLAAAPPKWPTTAILDHVWRRCRWIEEQHRRTHAVACADAWGAETRGPLVRVEAPDVLDRAPSVEPSVSAGEELAAVLEEAVRRGVVGRPGAALVYESRVVGRSVAEIARRRGVDEGLLRYHRGRAERQLVAAEWVA